MMNPAAARVLDTSFGAAGGPAINFSLPIVYPGLERLHQECSRVYPTQPNPLQLKSRVKFWDGGPDPLDYISIYSNSGTSNGEIPPHWHYVSFGLTDLYGDGRVYPLQFLSNEENSGFGFELTFRLKKDTVNPPVWPGVLLQKLATYTFTSGNPFLHGDHISWHHSLADTEESRLQHLLVANDPELRGFDGPFGKTRFVQIVGATIEELEAVQHWNGPSFLELMKQNQDCGGRYLITDLRRGESLFELDPSVQEKVTEGVMKDGSTLSGVTAAVSWEIKLPLNRGPSSSKIASEELRRNSSGSSTGSCNNSPAIKDLLQSRGDLSAATPDMRYTGMDKFGDEQLIGGLAMGGDPDDDTALGARFCPSASNGPPEHNPAGNSKPKIGGEDLVEEFANLMQDVSMTSMSVESTKSTQNLVDELVDETVFHETIHLTLSLEAALLIPLVVRGRIRHGRHFTFKSQHNDCAVTIVAPYVTGSYADMENKFASRGNWLQICLDEELADKLLKDFDELKKVEMVAFPTTIYSLGNKFALTVTL